jgi:hypothetical protein
MKFFFGFVFYVFPPVSFRIYTYTYICIEPINFTDFADIISYITKYTSVSSIVPKGKERASTQREVFRDMRYMYTIANPSSCLPVTAAYFSLYYSAIPSVLYIDHRSPRIFPYIILYIHKLTLLSNAQTPAPPISPNETPL